MRQTTLECDWCETTKRCNDEEEELEAFEDGWSLLYLYDHTEDEVVVRSFCSDECRRSWDS